MEDAPFYILFAGVNGAGKSTLYHTGIWQAGTTMPIEGGLPRVNSDEIIVENGWDWREQSAQMRAGKIAVKRIREHFAKRESFNQETTLTGRSIMKSIRAARETGWRIILFYIGLDDPAIANERVAKRDAAGGHFIPPETIARRYETSLANLADAIPLCDESFLYDNSYQLELEARFNHDALAYFNPLEPRLSWVKRTCEALGYHEIEL